jgi:hypothetical protein
MDLEDIKEQLSVLTEQVSKLVAPRELEGTFPLVNKKASQIIAEKKLSVKSDDNSDTLRGIMTLSTSKGQAAKSREDYRPTKEQLTKINQIALEDQGSPEGPNGYVLPLQATNSKNGIDRSFEGISNTALNELKEYGLKNVIPLLVASEADCQDHTWKAINAYGYVIGASVKDGALYYDMFVPEHEGTKDMLNRLFSGQINKLSIGFSMDRRDYKCNTCSKPVISEECPHYPGEVDAETGKVNTMTIEHVRDNFEISGVAVPCQQEASTVRNSLSSGETTLGLKSALEVFNHVKADDSNGIVSKSEVLIPDEIFKALNDSVVEKIKELLSVVPDKIQGDKIPNDNNTIKDNSVTMADDTKATETEAAPVCTEDSVTMSETKLCKVAEKIKAEVVSELKAELSKQDEKLNSLVEAIKALDAKIDVKAAQEKAEDASRALQLQIAKLEGEVAANRGVPGSKAYVDSKVQGSDATSVNIDVLTSAIGPLLNG